MSLDAHQQRAVDDAIARNLPLDGALMPLLHAVQDSLGFIPLEAVPPIAAALNLSVADVHGVVSFYHDFRTSPPGRHTLKMCRAEACKSVGADHLVDQARRVCGVDLGGTSKDNAVTLEAAYCLGLCASGPAALVDGRPVARLTPARVDALLTRMMEGG